jgi:protein-disulfide isomerase
MAVLALAGAQACGGKSPTSPSSTVDPGVTLPSLDSMLADKVLGGGAAPVTMIEYSSLSCSHCADFHAQTLPQIKSNYIDPGQVKLVFRDFPLDDGATLFASMVARCSGDRFFTVVDLLFKSQATWAGSSNVASALKSVVAPTGMTGAEVDACLARTDLKTGIQSMRAQGVSTYGVSGTPTFIINGQKVVGAAPYSTFVAIFNGSP